MCLVMFVHAPQTMARIRASTQCIRATRSTRLFVDRDAKSKTEQRKCSRMWPLMLQVVNRRIRQRAYRERKVNHTMELEDRITYLQGHIQELQVENKQLEVDISRTRVENVVLRKDLLSKVKSSSASTTSSQPTPMAGRSSSDSGPRAKGVLLKDLLMHYGY